MINEENVSKVYAAFNQQGGTAEQLVEEIKKHRLLHFHAIHNYILSLFHNPNEHELKFIKSLLEVE